MYEVVNDQSSTGWKRPLGLTFHIIIIIQSPSLYVHVGWISKCHDSSNVLTKVVPDPHTQTHTKVHSRSVDPWKLCGVRIAINYTPLSMAYYTYDSIHVANFSSLGRLQHLYVHVCISKEWCCKEELRGAGNLEFDPVIRKLQQFFWGSTEPVMLGSIHALEHIEVTYCVILLTIHWGHTVIQPPYSVYISTCITL